MEYLGPRKLFLFDMIDEYFKLLDDLENCVDYVPVIIKINAFFLNMSNGFVEILFKVVYQHIKKLELNIFAKSKMIDIIHIRNIYKDIVNNKRVVSITREIKKLFEDSDFEVKFEIHKYESLMNLMEELDFICAFEMYSYLLREDSEDVFNFLVKYLTNEFVDNENRNYKFINGRVLKQIENKVKIFKKNYNDYDDIDLVSKNEDHIIYKVNDVVKIINYTEYHSE